MTKHAYEETSNDDKARLLSNLPEGWWTGADSIETRLGEFLAGMAQQQQQQQQQQQLQHQQQQQQQQQQQRSGGEDSSSSSGMEEDEEEEAGATLIEDTVMGNGNTRGVKPVERGGSGMLKATIKKNKGKGGGKISSHSSEGGRRDQKTSR
jgi:hypothetical protein